MYKTQLETLIKYLQCKFATFSNKVADRIALGICSEELLNKLTEASYLLELFYRHKVFLQEVTNAQKFDITSEITETVVAQLRAGTRVLSTYSGVGDPDIMLAFYVTNVNANTSTNGYYAELIEGSLYLYSYENTETYADNININFLTQPNVTYTSESLENNLSDLLNLWNCLTVCNMSNIKNKFIKLISL